MHALRRLLDKCDRSAAESAARDQYTPREVVLTCGMLTLFCAFLTFGGRVPLFRAFSDPSSDRSLVCFLCVVVGLFWLGVLHLWYWTSRWFVHYRALPPEERGSRRFLSLEQDPSVTVEDGLPVSWSAYRRYGAGELLALSSFFLFLIGPGEAAVWLLTTQVFHLDPAKPRASGPPGDVAFLLSMCAVLTIAMLLGKYAWLLAMSRWLTRAQVAPFIAWGLPRRLLPFDRWILDRFYRD